MLDHNSQYIGVVSAKLEGSEPEYVKFTSSNEDVVTIDSGGAMHSQGYGTATITATYSYITSDGETSTKHQLKGTMEVTIQEPAETTTETPATTEAPEATTQTTPTTQTTTPTSGSTTTTGSTTSNTATNTATSTNNTGVRSTKRTQRTNTYTYNTYPQSHTSSKTTRKLVTGKKGIEYIVTTTTMNGRTTKTAVVKGYKGKSKTVTIPKTITVSGLKVKVTGIEKKAFQKKNVTKIKVPSSTISTIGKNAFQVKNVKDLTIQIPKKQKKQYSKMIVASTKKVKKKMIVVK